MVSVKGVTNTITHGLKLTAIGVSSLVVIGAVVIVSPIVGAAGLLCTGVRAIHDYARYKFAQYTLNHAINPSPLNERKVTYYKCRLDENRIHAGVFGNMLIPIIGFPRALRNNQLLASSVVSGTDIVGAFPCLKNLSRKLFFVYAGKTLEQLGKRHYQLLRRQSLNGIAAAGKSGNLFERVPEWKGILEYQRKFVIDNPTDTYKKWYMKHVRGPLLTRYQGEQLYLKTADQRTIDAVWVPNGRVSVDQVPTVIVFHGNACVLDDLETHLSYLKDKGYNVLMTTMGGYPGSAERTNLTETTLYHDVEAIGNHLKGLNIDNRQTVAYGWSMGGALAVQYGATHPGSHVIADQTFTSLAAVAKNIVDTPQANPSIGRLVEHILFPTGVKKGNFTTNGLNSLEKVSRLKGEFCVIQSQNDHMMKVRHTNRNFGEILADEFAATTNKVKRVVAIPGGHGTFFGDSPAAVAQLDEFFQRINLQAGAELVS